MYGFLVMFNSNIGPNQAPLQDISHLSRSLKVKSNGAVGLPIYDFLLVSNSNQVSNSHRLGVTQPLKNVLHLLSLELNFNTPPPRHTHTHIPQGDILLTDTQTYRQTDPQTHTQTQSKKPHHATHGQGLVILVWCIGHAFGVNWPYLQSAVAVLMGCSILEYCRDKGYVDQVCFLPALVRKGVGCIIWCNFR